jgi:hypothetical protein
MAIQSLILDLSMVIILDLAIQIGINCLNLEKTFAKATFFKINWIAYF